MFKNSTYDSMRINKGGVGFCLLFFMVYLYYNGDECWLEGSRGNVSPLGLNRLWISADIITGEVKNIAFYC